MRLSVWLRSRSWVFVGLLLLVGCGDNPDAEIEEGTADPVAVEDSTGIKTVDASKLPPLGDPLPTLDGGRIDGLAPPKGWEPLARDNKHVARFAKNKGAPNDLPRILVTVEDASGFTEDVTADNVAAFAESVAGEDTKFLETPKAIILGDNAYSRHVTEAKKGGRVVERQVLETVSSGRRYAIILEVYRGQLVSDDGKTVSNRDLAYAVAAGVKYPKAEGAPVAPKKDDTPAEEKAETKSE